MNDITVNIYRDENNSNRVYMTILSVETKIIIYGNTIHVNIDKELPNVLSIDGPVTVWQSPK